MLFSLFFGFLPSPKAPEVEMEPQSDLFSHTEKESFFIQRVLLKNGDSIITVQQFNIY